MEKVKVYLSNLQKISEDLFTAGYYHGIPFDPMFGLGKPEEELLQTGAVVDSFDMLSPVDGKNVVIMYKPSNNTAWTEYINAPPRELTPFELLQQENETLKAQNAEIIYNLVLNGLM